MNDAGIGNRQRLAPRAVTRERLRKLRASTVAVTQSDDLEVSRIHPCDLNSSLIRLSAAV